MLDLNNKFKKLPLYQVTSSKMNNDLHDKMYKQLHILFTQKPEPC